MDNGRRRAHRLLSSTAEAVSAILFLAAFAGFLIQIFFRYALGAPLRWSEEFTMVAFVWTVFWTTAFLVPLRDHVSFDALFEKVSPRLQTLFTVFSFSIALAAFALLVLPTLDYLGFLTGKLSPVLRLPMHWVYASYALFAAGLTLKLAIALAGLPRKSALVAGFVSVGIISASIVYAVSFQKAPGEGGRIELQYTTASVPSDTHTQAMGVFADALEARAPGDFDVKLFDSGTLFGQGSDLDALQRGNAQLTYLSFQLIADQLPRYSLLTAGYLFQNPDHYRRFLASDIGQVFVDDVSEKMGVTILDACYLGTRQLHLRRPRDVQTPADLAGLKLRMPGSNAWLFLGEALGAAPTPMPFGEVYLGLQTGAIDGHDNPLPTAVAARFYEVTEQVVLTGHLVDALTIVISNQIWDELSPPRQDALRAAARASCDWNNSRRLAEEARLTSFFQDEGIAVTRPDVDAFRTHVQGVYAASDRSALWPDGWIDQINNLASE